MQALVGMATYCPHRKFGERPRGSKIVRAEGQTNAQLKTLASVPPEVLEPVRRQGRVDRSAGDRSMAEPCLDGTDVVPLVGEGISAGVAEHVRVRLEVEALIAEMMAIPGTHSWAKSIFAACCGRDTAVLLAPTRREKGPARGGAEVGNARHRYTESTLAEFGDAFSCGETTLLPKVSNTCVTANK
jgi:hypothetical protein